MTDYFLARFKVTVDSFKKNDVYFFDENNIAHIPKNIIEFISINEVADYTNQPNLLIIRSGGIGDIAALSCLHDVGKVTLLTQDKYRPFANLWKTPPTFKALTKPVFRASSLTELRSIIKHYGQLSTYVDSIEHGNRENWYDVFQKSLGLDVEYRRPQLVSPIVQQREGCLLVTKASSKHRTLHREQVMQAVSPFFKVIVNADAMNYTTEQYIEALAGYTYCITTDTSASHIREGFGMKSLALYGAFDKDSRSSGYKYTTSIQIQSECPYQPCHLPNSLSCPNMIGGFSMCSQGDKMIKQIQEHLSKEYLTPHAPLLS